MLFKEIILGGFVLWGEIKIKKGEKKKNEFIENGSHRSRIRALAVRAGS